MEQPIAQQTLRASWTQSSEDMRFAAAVAGFGQLLRGGEHTGTWGYPQVIDTAAAARGTDEFGYRAEFVSLVRLASTLGH